MHAGDEALSHEQANPELYDDRGSEVDGDPLDLPCDDCGAEAGEECRPTCTALG